MASAFKFASVLLCIIAAYSASAFTTSPSANGQYSRQAAATSPSSTTQLDFFGKAFANDDSLGERENAGLKKVRARRMESFLFFEIGYRALCSPDTVVAKTSRFFLMSPRVRRSDTHRQGPKVSEVTVNGKPVKAVAGQKVSQVLASARVKMTYR